MKYFVVVSALLVVARAGVIAPIALQAPTIVAAVPVGQHSSQYHSQDAIGQYAYGYANELSAKNEIKSADGQTVGSYSYIDAEGKLQNVQYRSDALHGFRVSATNLPVGPAPIEAAALSLPEPVRDTPEVIEARSRHLEALRLAEEEHKKSADSVSVEVQSAIHAHPAVITAASPAAVVRTAPATIELIRAAPIIAAPSFGYSFGINYGGLYAVNSYSSHQPIFTAYAAPGSFIAAPIVAEAGPIIAALPEAPKDLPEVVEARAKHLEAVENIKKDIEEQKLLVKE